MKLDRLDKMVRGWFVGNFAPTALKTDACEVGVKYYKAGDYEKAHYHKIATEVTVVVSGEAELNGKRFGSGDIITLSPGDITDFRAITDVTTAVVKLPGALNDKYEV